MNNDKNQMDGNATKGNASRDAGGKVYDDKGMIVENKPHNAKTEAPDPAKPAQGKDATVKA